MPLLTYASFQGKKQGMFKGNTGNIRRPGWCQIESVETASAGAGGSSNSGTPKGSRHHHPIIITKEHDAASAQLLQACYGLEILTRVIIEVSDISASGFETLRRRITLRNALITEIRPCLRRRPVEKVLTDIKLTFETITNETFGALLK